MPFSIYLLYDYLISILFEIFSSNENMYYFTNENGWEQTLKEVQKNITEYLEKEDYSSILKKYEKCRKCKNPTNWYFVGTFMEEIVELEPIDNPVFDYYNLPSKTPSHICFLPTLKMKV